MSKFDIYVAFDELSRPQRLSPDNMEALAELLPLLAAEHRRDAAEPAPQPQPPADATARAQADATAQARAANTVDFEEAWTRIVQAERRRIKYQTCVLKERLELAEEEKLTLISVVHAKLKAAWLLYGQ